MDGEEKDIELVLLVIIIDDNSPIRDGHSKMPVVLGEPFDVCLDKFIEFFFEEEVLEIKIVSIPIKFANRPCDEASKHFVIFEKGDEIEIRLIFNGCNRFSHELKKEESSREADGDGC